MKVLGVSATARASFYLYSDRDDVDVLIEALQEARKYFGYSR
jgi:cysteine desulfurase/selenocysteine lyase